MVLEISIGPTRRVSRLTSSGSGEVVRGMSGSRSDDMVRQTRGIRQALVLVQYVLMYGMRIHFHSCAVTLQVDKYWRRWQGCMNSSFSMLESAGMET